MAQGGNSAESPTTGRWDFPAGARDTAVAGKRCSRVQGQGEAMHLRVFDSWAAAGREAHLSSILAENGGVLIDSVPLSGTRWTRSQARSFETLWQPLKDTDYA